MTPSHHARADGFLDFAPRRRYSIFIMANSLANLSVAQLKSAVSLKERIQKLEKKLAAIIGASDSAPAAVKVVRRRRKMSAEARAKISAAQHARWAKQKAGKK
jgi:hypothetical protein